MGACPLDFFVSICLAGSCAVKHRTPGPLASRTVIILLGLQARSRGLSESVQAPQNHTVKKCAHVGAGPGFHPRKLTPPPPAAAPGAPHRQGQESGES